MNESYVTLQGWVGGDVDVRDVGDTQCASFRVGSTPRYLRNGSWVDGQTSWFTVNCWRALGKNVKESVQRGDAVVVHGRVRVDVWEREDKPSSVHVGRRRDLRRPRPHQGHQRFTKTAQALTRDPREDDAVREMVHAYEADGPQLDAAGDPVTPADRRPPDPFRSGRGVAP